MPPRLVDLRSFQGQRGRFPWELRAALEFWPVGEEKVVVLPGDLRRADEVLAGVALVTVIFWFLHDPHLGQVGPPEEGEDAAIAPERIRAEVELFQVLKPLQDRDLHVVQVVSRHGQLHQRADAEQTCIADVSELILPQVQGHEVSQGRQVLAVDEVKVVVGKVEQLQQLKTHERPLLSVALSWQDLVQLVACQVQNLDIGGAGKRPLVHAGKIVVAEVELGQGLVKMIEGLETDGGDEVVRDVELGKSDEAEVFQAGNAVEGEVKCENDGGLHERIRFYDSDVIVTQVQKLKITHPSQPRPWDHLEVIVAQIERLEGKQLWDVEWREAVVLQVDPSQFLGRRQVFKSHKFSKLGVESLQVR